MRGTLNSTVSTAASTGSTTSAQQRVQFTSQISVFPTLAAATPVALKRQDQISRIVSSTNGSAGTAGTNATAERINLEKQLEPLREKQRQAQEVAMQARQVAVQQARNEGRMVKAGIGPKPGGLPWEYVQSTAYADGSVVETPASPPAHVQTIYQMAAAKVAASQRNQRCLKNSSKQKVIPLY